MGLLEFFKNLFKVKIHADPPRIKRTICIFCPTALDGSNEHIIPDSLNGSLQSKGIICSVCNNHFGRNVDPIIKETFNPLLNIIGFENATGMRAEDISGTEFSVSKDFVVRPIKPQLKEEIVDGKTKVTITGDPKNTIKMFAGYKKKMEASGRKFVSSTTIDSKNTTPNIKIKFEIKSDPRLVLFLNKLALEFFCLYETPNKTINDLCKSVRASDTTFDNVIFCNFLNEIRDFEMDEVSHVVVIKNDKKANVLYAYIELLNVICCVVILDNNYKGKNIYLQYRQDAITRGRFDSIIKLKLKYKEIIKQKGNNNFQFLVNTIGDRLRHREFNTIFREGLNEIVAAINSKIGNQEITKKQSKDLYIQEAGELFAYLSIYKCPYLFDSKDQEDNDEYNYIHSNFKESVVDDFITQYRSFIGKKVVINNSVYTITDFHKVPLIVRGNKTLISLYVILTGPGVDDAKYLPVKQIIDSFIQEAERLANRSS